MRLLVFLAAALPALGQPVAVTADLNAPHVFFDDLDYAHPVDWVDREGGSYGSLYGPNAWLTGTDQALGVETVRAWYATSGWLDFGDWLTLEDARDLGGTLRNIATQTRDTPGWVVLESDGGRAGRSLLGFSSAFEARYGTWVARVRMSPMGEALGSVVHTPLWLQGSNSARDARELPGLFSRDGRSWFEINFEINRWYADGCDRPREPIVSCNVNAGVSWGHLAPLGGNDRLRTDADVYNANCRVRAEPGGTWTSGAVRPDTECARILTNAAYAGDVYAYFLIRVTPTRSYQAVAAFDETRDGLRRDRIDGFESLWMDTPRRGLRHYAPPDRMRMISSLGLWQDEPFAVRMETDWMYYAPDTSLGLREVLGDVERLRALFERADVRDARGDRVTRINTTGLGLANPHTYRSEAPRACYAGWLSQTADLPPSVRIEGPFATPDGPLLRALPDQPYDRRFAGRTRIRWEGWYGTEARGRPDLTLQDHGFDLLLADARPGPLTLRATLTIEGAHTWRDWSVSCPDAWFHADTVRTVTLP